MNGAATCLEQATDTNPQPLPTVDDKSLLDRFVANRDEEAFATLLSRHGPMVLAVCRRVLSHTQDAEDAFQATFLVLARQARQVSRRSSVGSWLYGVAYRVSLRARRSMTRRQAHEQTRVSQSSPDSVTNAADEEFRQILDEEFHKLPIKFREPLVLCYLEGKSNEEVASELHCPVGTVFSRLARGRERLRDRLARRGVVFTAAMLTASLAAQGASAAAAAVPTVLAATTVKAAASFALGAPSAVAMTSTVAGLTQGTIRSLLLAQVQQIAMIAVTVGVVATGGGFIARAVYNRNFSDHALAASADSRQLQGSWQVVSVEQNGKEQSDEDLKAADTRMIFEGAKLRKLSLVRGREVAENVSYSLDPSQSPKAIDLSMGGRSVLGIYEVDGEKLKICVDRNPGHRPVQFATGQGTQEMLQVLNRMHSARSK